MPAPYLLDANACIVHLRSGGTCRLSARLRARPVGGVVLCSVDRSELLFDAYRNGNPGRRVAEVKFFLAGFASYPFDDRAAAVNVDLRATLEPAGLGIGPFDSLIAAVAVANGLMLVTHNTREFSRISGLQIEDWQ